MNAYIETKTRLYLKSSQSTFMCEVCGKTYKTHKNLCRHQRDKEDIFATCFICLKDHTDMIGYKKCLKSHQTNKLKPNKELSKNSKFVFKKYDQDMKEGKVDNKTGERVGKNSNGMFCEQHVQTLTSIASNDNTSGNPPNTPTIGKAIRTSERTKRRALQAGLKPLKVVSLKKKRRKLTAGPPAKSVKKETIQKSIPIVVDDTDDTDDITAVISADDTDYADDTDDITAVASADGKAAQKMPNVQRDYLDSTETTKCKDCYNHYDGDIRFNLHFESHIYPFSCPKCKKNFRTEVWLNVHVKMAICAPSSLFSFG